MEILCFDASGSTKEIANYWNVIVRLSQLFQFYALLSWSDNCKSVSNVLENRAFGGTHPTSFMDYIVSDFNKDFIEKTFGSDAGLSLQITTDGQIDTDDINRCAEYLRKPNFPRLKKVTIHYIGILENMNFGLNAIFGSVTDLSFTINDINAVKRVPSVQELENYDNIFSSEFLSFLCSRVPALKTSNYEAFVRLRDNLVVKLDNKYSTLNKLVSPKEYFDNKDAAGLENAINDRLVAPNDTEYRNWRAKILSSFDGVSKISLATVQARPEPNVVDDYQIERVVIEENITFLNITEVAVFVLVKIGQTALFEPDSKHVRNPLLILQDEDIRSKLIERFELHYLSISAVKQQVKGNTIVSPFTGDVCRAFILNPANMDEINFNSAALISLFRSVEGDTIYGDKLLWQLVILYSMKINLDSMIQTNQSVTRPQVELQPSINSILKKFILNEVFLYHLTLHIKIQLPVKRVPLYVALWYIIEVAPNFSANNTSRRNILQYPGAPILLNLIEDANLIDVISLGNETRQRLPSRVKSRQLWSEMIGRNDIELKLTIIAAYQNYRMVQVLRSGAQPSAPADIVSGIPPAILIIMLDSLTRQSERSNEINDENVVSFQPPETIILTINECQAEQIHQGLIDLNTLRLTEISGELSIEWDGSGTTFDTRSESYTSIFLLFCEIYTRYPESPDQLAVLHNRISAVDNNYIVNYMKYVFEIYQPVMKTMKCEEFVRKCKKYGFQTSKVKLTFISSLRSYTWLNFSYCFWAISLLVIIIVVSIFTSSLYYFLKR